jgi:hypothetical protein
MARKLSHHKTTPKFTAEHSLYASAARYFSSSALVGFSTDSRVSPQLRVGWGLGADDPCDGCATFSFMGCLQDCGGDSDCRDGCVARSLECGLCQIDAFRGFGGGVLAL